MQDNEKKPALRFKGFTDPWEQRKIGDHLIPSKLPGHTGVDARKLTVKLWGKGVVEKTDSYGGSEHTQYYVRHAGQFMYGKLDFLHAAFGIVPAELDNYESTLDSPAFDLSEINGKFLVSRVCKEDFYLKYGTIANGSRKAKRIHEDTFMDMPILVPELEEQERVAALLEALDTLITLHQRKYEKLVNIKKSMLDKMFPKNGASVPEIRFKGFTDPWEQRKLGDITVELSEYATQELGLPLLTSSRSGLMYQDEYRDSRTTKSTETLFSVVPVGTCTYRHMSDDDVFHMNINTLEKGLVSREYPVFEASKGNNLEFLVQHINSSEEFKAFCAEQKKGGTRTRLYYNTLCQFTVRVPALKEQAQISQCLKKLDTLITLHQREHIKPILEVKRVKRNE